MTRPERIVFAGLARDCADMLPHTLANLERMAAEFADSAFLFLENDSKDNTRAILEAWCAARPNADVLSPAQPLSPHLTIRLATLRNQLLDEAGARFADFDLLAMVDCDEANATPVTFLQPLHRAVDFLLADPNHVAVTANTLGVYYDMWALRHAARCPNDVWEAVMDAVLTRGISDEQATADVFLSRRFEIAGTAPPMAVESAFNGLGLYRLARVLASGARYHGYKLRPIQGQMRGWQVCEHVALHAGLRAAGGRIFILPWLVNGKITELTVSPTSWRGMIFDPATL